MSFQGPQTVGYVEFNPLPVLHPVQLMFQFAKRGVNLVRAEMQYVSHLLFRVTARAGTSLNQPFNFVWSLS